MQNAISGAKTMSARAGNRKAPNAVQRDRRGAPLLRVQITKRAGGGAVLNCTRADGTVTWQKQEGPNGVFFPYHDLTHYAVETVLGFRHAFYGLLADGWTIDDTGGKGARGRLPAGAILVEHIVGLFDSERRSLATMTAAEFNALLAGFLAEKRIDVSRTVTDAELDAVRARTRELFRSWKAIAEGGVLELPFGEPAA